MMLQHHRERQVQLSKQLAEISKVIGEEGATCKRVEKTKGRKSQEGFFSVHSHYNPSTACQSQKRLIESRQLRKSPKKLKKHMADQFFPRMSTIHLDLYQCEKREDKCTNPEKLMSQLKVCIINKSQAVQEVQDPSRLKPLGLQILQANPVVVEGVSVHYSETSRVKRQMHSEQLGQDGQRKRTLEPIDSRLENSKNAALKSWMFQKNALIRKESAVKMRQRQQKAEELKRRESDMKRKQKESEEKVKKWMERKRKEGKKEKIAVKVATVPRILSVDVQIISRNIKRLTPASRADRKSIIQNSSRAWKTDQQVNQKRLERQSWGSFVPDPGNPRTKVSSQLSTGSFWEQVVNAEPGDWVTQKPSREKTKMAGAMGQEIEENTGFEPTGQNSIARSLGSTAQVKYLPNASLDKSVQPVHRLSFNQWLSRKSQKKTLMVNGEEVESDRGFQDFLPKLARKRTESIMDRKKKADAVLEFDRVANLMTAPECTTIPQTSHWVGSARLTPAVQKHFMYRLVEDAVTGAGGDSLVQGRERGPGQPQKAPTALCAKSAAGESPTGFVLKYKRHLRRPDPPGRENHPTN
ncbi:DNA ligase 1-like [Callorhinchus milii]|uniref:DNA ligase 1-like n=1 Tax=Callorhinchus milii TaxID=7868 RepID=UPI0004572EDF|nr:DNA ligase 1-like [Callorhinchus milii]XP_007903302.1 DNA ligase 1-like [Callorhinchus milii]|eukprot:gi/632973740/ref/XP_007903300.1/ PREDICTED: uncharacterized protein LOC103186222 [Callorhinchus milii]